MVISVHPWEKAPIVMEADSPQITQIFTGLFWSTDETDDTEAHLLRLCLASGMLTLDIVANSTSIARAKIRVNLFKSVGDKNTLVQCHRVDKRKYPCAAISQ